MRADVVPLRDHARFALIPQHAQRCGAQREEPAAVGGRPSQQAVSTRSMWPCANNATSPAAASARAITRLARAATCWMVSPCGTGDVQMVHPGTSFLDLGAGAAFVSAIVPFAEVGIDLRHFAVTRQPAGFARALQRAGQHQGETAARRGSARYPRRALRRRQSGGGPCVRCAAPRGSTRSHRDESAKFPDGNGLLRA